MPARRKTSRILIGLLGIVIAVAAIGYWRSAGKTPPQAQPVATAVDTPTPPVLPAHVDHRPALAGDTVITSTPSLAVHPAAPEPVLLAEADAVTPPPVAPAVVENDAPAVPSDQAIAQAKAKTDAGELLAARDILNRALIGGELSGADQKLAKQMIATLNDTLIFSSKPFADDPWQETYTVQSGDVMVRIANRFFIPYELISRLNNDIAPNRIRPGQKLKVLKGPFHAVVDKSDFTIDLYLGTPGGPGSMYIRSFPVGLGAEGSTPPGLWNVPKGAKLRNPVYYSPRGEGIIAADDPKNPLGDYWIAIEGVSGEAVGKTSFGIHGTIEPDSIGRQASMGCIRLRNEDIKQVYEMLYEVKSNVKIQD